MTDQRMYEAVKIHRGHYVVEYKPLVAPAKFALLNVIFLEALPEAQIRNCLKLEIDWWMDRYPLPIMATGLSNTDNVLHFGANSSAHAVGWICPDRNVVIQSRHMRNLDNVLRNMTSLPDCEAIYRDLPSHAVPSRDDRVKKSLESARANHFLKLAFFFWLAIIPVGWAVFTFLGPAWVGIFGLLYAMHKAAQMAIRTWWPNAMSKAELTRQEQQKLEHYAYHCERNPVGFMRLKGENDDDDARSQILNDFPEPDGLSDPEEQVGASAASPGTHQTLRHRPSA